jgi:hypothetical protein
MPENIKEKIGFESENQVGETSKRKDEVVDLGKEVTVPREIDTWLQKHEKANTGVTKLGEDGGVKGNLATDEVVIDLPVTRNTFAQGLKKPVDEVGRWLSTFISKLIKIKEGKVKFKEE